MPLPRRLVPLVTALLAVSLLPVSSVSATVSGRSPRSERSVAPSSRPSCTITGTQGPDVLRGTPGRDVICGLGGRDRIRGLGGDDVLIGGRGNDIILGGPGNDVLIGGPGNDTLYGGSGDDVIRGGDGSDSEYGATGADRIWGGRGINFLYGDRGDDTCVYSASDWVIASCTFDHADPVISWVTLSASTVDVTSSAAIVTIRAHISDDVAIISHWAPYVFLYDNRVDVPPVYDPTEHQINLHRVSGTAKNGIWEGRARVPEGFPATTLDLMLAAADPMLNVVVYKRSGVLEVVDDAS